MTVRDGLDIDIYDGHLLESYFDGDELVHDVRHPPTCPTIEVWDGYWDHACAITHVYDWSGVDVWSEHTTPGVRVIGWRHDHYPGGPWGSSEYDLNCWALPDDISAQITRSEP